MRSASLSNLAEPSFIDRDAEAITAEMIAAFEASTGRTLYPAQPERLEIDMVAYREQLLRVGIQSAALQNLLAYASGALLDHKAAFFGVTRLAAQPATTTLRFSLAAVRPDATVIASGVQVASKDGLVFATTAEALILAGQASVDVTAQAVTAGEAGNGYLPGEVATLVTALDGVSVTNLDATQGGAADEDDERLRERTRLAPEGWSSAGPDDAYLFWAMSAHQSIVDVAILSPSPGVVAVYPLMADGLPTTTHLSAVAAVLNRKEIRPLTDQVMVAAPEAVPYAIAVTLTLEPDAPAEATRTAAATALTALAATWAGSLGQDIITSRIVATAAVDGVHDVSLTSPATSTRLTASQWAQCTGVTVALEGYDA
ncbi:baseplate J/gp47 family protein [Fundidesulfovibrio butyratiphilus]